MDCYFIINSKDELSLHIGSFTLNIVPSSILLDTHIEPLWASIIFLHMCSPTPVPPYFLLVEPST